MRPKEEVEQSKESKKEQSGGRFGKGIDVSDGQGSKRSVAVAAAELIN